MSHRTDNYVFHMSETKGNDRLVLLALSDEAKDDGLHCHPSIRTIARKARVGVRTALRCIERLETQGEILVARPDKHGRGRYNTYALILGREPSEVSQLLAAIAGKGVNLTPIENREMVPSEQEMVPSEVEKGATHGVTDPYVNRPVVNRPPVADATPAKTDEATHLVKAWYDELVASGEPKPAQPWPALVGVVRKMLKAGYPTDQIAWALREAPAVSTATLTLAINKRKKPQGKTDQRMAELQSDNLHAWSQIEEATSAH